MNNFFLASLSKAFNAYLQLDPESKFRLAKLRGKIITIELLPFNIIFQCLFTPDGIELRKDELATSDVSIRGTPLQMLGVVLAKEERQRFFADDVKIEGDAELGQQVIALFDDLHIDWEEHLSHIIGDVPAYNIGSFMRRLGKNLRQKEEAFSEHLKEFIQEEANWLPTREALDDFFDDIDNLRMDVDRIEVKIKYLQNLYVESHPVESKMNTEDPQ